MKKVLLVDDKPHFHALWMWGLREKFTFLNAYTIHEGRQLFWAHSDVSAIVVDACMDGSLMIDRRVPMRQWGFNTGKLINEFRLQFKGPIIAAPCQPWHFQLMINAGCTHYAWKWRVARLLNELLK